jgi:hypothetical protein
VPIRPLQLYADGGYQLRIRRLEGTPNYGPRQYVIIYIYISLKRKKICKKKIMWRSRIDPHSRPPGECKVRFI